MTHNQFARVVSNWMENTIMPNIGDKALLTQGAIATFAELIKIRPSILFDTVTTVVPFVKMCGVVTDDSVDTMLVRVGLTTFFDKVNEVKLQEHIKRFPYTLNKQEISALCNALERAETESSQCVTRNPSTN